MVTVEEELLVEETELSDDEEVQDVRYDIMPYPADYTLKGLYDKWQSEQLLIPDFQRNYIWTQPQASRFIESFLLGLPVPQVFLYRDRSDPRLTVIDGHQRLGTIARFYSGELRLRRVNSPWEGRVYDELSDYDRSVLDDSTLRAIVVRQIQPNNNSSVYEIFRRLNTGGSQLNDMEIRRAVSISRGGAISFLDLLNDNADWRAIIGTSEPAPRFRDVELVLRVLALSREWRNYGKRDYGGQSMKTFMDKYTELLDKTNAPLLEQLEERFNKACQTIVSQLGEKPFHLRGRLNLGALDSVMASTIEIGDSLKAEISEEYSKLKLDSDFLDAVTHNTSHTAEVHQRFSLVHSAFSC